MTLQDTLETCCCSPSPTTARTLTLFVPIPKYFVTSISFVVPAPTNSVNELLVAPLDTVTVILADSPVLSCVSVFIWSYLYLSFTVSPSYTVGFVESLVNTILVARDEPPPPPPVNVSVVSRTPPFSSSNERL